MDVVNYCMSADGPAGWSATVLSSVLRLASYAYALGLTHASARDVLPAQRILIGQNQMHINIDIGAVQQARSMYNGL